MRKLVVALPPAARDCLCQWLAERGYAKAVYVDEMQAYFSTGLPPDVSRGLKRHAVNFERVFKHWRAHCKTQ